MPDLQELINKHLAQEPSVFRISVQGVVDSYRHFRCVHSPLQVGINIAAFVGFRQQVVEVKHGDGVSLGSKIRIGEVVTANVVYLAVRYQQTWNRQPKRQSAKIKKAANRLVNCLIYCVTPERLELSTQ